MFFCSNLHELQLAFLLVFPAEVEKVTSSITVYIFRASIAFGCIFGRAKPDSGDGRNTTICVDSMEVPKVFLPISFRQVGSMEVLDLRNFYLKSTCSF